MGITATSTSTPIINFSDYYRKRAASVELPEPTAWLEFLQLELRAVTCANIMGTGSKVQYQVVASYTPPLSKEGAIVWSITKPFDAYRRFRKQLLRKLQRGHVCPAECKWLYTVIKNHFPKPNLLPINTSRVVETRCQALARLLQTLQASLVNRGNQGCKVLVHSVCQEFTSFIFGENPKIPEMAMALSGCSSDQSTRDSSASFASGSDDDDYYEGISSGDSFGRTGRGYCKSESGQ
ncbi:hypothetical protein PHMEG_00030129 [Phytophthora megakarya]|uniref:PX domain-containing protein n=1 Tax=Phytophthora megakarya TaxID=4795 RepID=A0A225V1C9_9STRA|nr:hypothetical protein PHMEG_00030129 [Phytophthora megakarya]